MVLKNIDGFDIEKIALSGQCFRINEIEKNKFEIIANSSYLLIHKKEEYHEFLCSEEEYYKKWEEYFGLKDDYGKIKSSVDPKDEFLKSAINTGWGIRILHQDLWEMIISFIISQRNNIKRIKGSIERLSQEFGNKNISAQGTEYYGFPTCQDLKDVSIEEFNQCGLGYRSKYLKKVVDQMLEEPEFLEETKKLSYEKAKEKLLGLYGVGNKVADCICLFGLQHFESFPVDVHIERILKNHYEKGFPFDRYEGHQGIIQQYAFFYALSNK